MNKLCIFVGMFVFSYVGWAVGGALGLEFFGCFLASGAGSVLGVWIGWKVAQKFG